MSAEKIRVQKLICVFFFFSWAKISYKVVVDIPFLVVQKAAIQRLSPHILSPTHTFARCMFRPSNNVVCEKRLIVVSADISFHIDILGKRTDNFSLVCAHAEPNTSNSHAARVKMT